MKPLLILTLTVVFSSFGQVVPGRYVVELQDDSAVETLSRQGVRHAAHHPQFAARRAAIRNGQQSVRAEVARNGGTVVESLDTVVNALIVNIPDNKAAALSRIAGVRKVHPVRKVQANLNHAAEVHNVSSVWSQLPQGQDSAGLGMKIALIDTGIDVHHPAFQDTLPGVEGFPKTTASSDSAFTNAKIIVARNYTTLLGRANAEPDADDRVGHGTATSMAAAGGVVSSPYGRISGMAPKAYIGNYKVISSAFGGTTSDVVAKAIDDAVADGMDVINVSIGGPVLFQSDIDPTSFDIAALERAAKAGVIVTVSAGNDGPDPGTIENWASAPSVIAVGAIDNNRIVAAAITVDGVAPYLGIPGLGTNPFTPVSGPVADVARIDGNGQACNALPAGSLANRIALIMRGTCSFEIKINNAAAAGALGAIVFNNTTTIERTSMITGTAQLPAMFTNNREGLDLRVRASAGIIVTLDFTNWDAFPTPPSLVSFSSRGPALGSALKPDLLAVGEEIVTAAQSKYSGGELYDPSGYINTQGTSFSAPIVAGAAAVLKAARPGLTVAQYRSLLINGAAQATRSDNSQTSVSEGGAGRLDLATAYSSTIAATPTSLNFGAGQRSISSTLDLALWNLGSSADTYSIQVVSASGSATPTLSSNTVTVDAGASQNLQTLVNQSSLDAGEYSGYLLVTGSQGQPTATIPYWFGVQGSTVKAISLVYADSSDSPRSTSQQALIVRLIDEAGLPYTGGVTPTARVLTTGTLTRIYRFGDYPGTYAMDVRTGASDMAIAISAGTITQTAIIPVF